MRRGKKLHKRRILKNLYVYRGNFFDLIFEAGRKAGSPATAARGSVFNDGGLCKPRSNDLPGPSGPVEEASLVATSV